MKQLKGRKHIIDISSSIRMTLRGASLQQLGQIYDLFTHWYIYKMIGINYVMQVDKSKTKNKSSWECKHTILEFGE